MRASLVAVLLLALLPAWAHAATPSTIGYRGDASHDNRITGAPDAPLGVLWATDLGAPMSYRERRPDAWGRAYAIDPICGKRRLPVPQGRDVPRAGRERAAHARRLVVVGPCASS